MPDANSLVGQTECALIYGFKQGSQEWLDARKYSVGGSTIAAVMALSQYKTRWQALADMVDSKSLFVHRTIMLGTVGESYLREWLSSKLGIAIGEIGMAVKRDAPWMRASPDGVYSVTRPDGSEGIGIVEIKVASSKARTRALLSSVKNVVAYGTAPDLMPIEHWHQVNYTAGVIGACEITYAVMVWPTEGPGAIIVKRFEPDRDLFTQKHVPEAYDAYKFVAVENS